jgi:hypothetical protein
MSYNDNDSKVIISLFASHREENYLKNTITYLILHYSMII